MLKQEMTEEERQDWLAMKQKIEDYLPTLHLQIIQFAPDGDQREFDFLIKKAIELRNTVAGINIMLNKKEL